jgi:alpha-N-arabinofuranosidase
MSGNVYLDGAKPSSFDERPLAKPSFDPRVQLTSNASGLFLEIRFDLAWIEVQSHQAVTSALLGNAAISDLPYEQPDGSPIRIDADYTGKSRGGTNPTPGPLERPGQGDLKIKVW